MRPLALYLDSLGTVPDFRAAEYLRSRVDHEKSHFYSHHCFPAGAGPDR